jgi:HAD superfamily hydrolase (TIGR01484 family)
LIAPLAYSMNKNTFQLLCTDFDGTLYSESQSPRIPEKLINLIQELKSQGVVWMVNTGRDLEYLLESLVEHSKGVMPDYIGAVEREVFIHQSGAYHPVDHWNQHSKAVHKTLFQRHSPLMLEVSEWISSRFEAEVFEDPHSPVCLIAQNNEDADQIHSFVNSKLKDYSELAWVRNDIYARFSHAHIHKGTILNEVAKLHQFPTTDVVVAGDHFNDIPMLSRKFAHHLLAPSNAIPAVRDHLALNAGFISDYEAGEGVWDGLRMLIENRI